MKKYWLLFFSISILFFIYACNFNSSQITNSIKVTYSNSVATIIYKNCTPCHRQNQIGHFNLLTYQDVLQNAAAIKYTVQNNLMPPWPADASYTHFANETILPSAEKKILLDWIANKCPIGDSALIPNAPTYTTSSMLGTPDLTIAIPPFQIKGNFEDNFLIEKVPFTLPAETYVHTIEFVPGNSKVVHHVNGGLVRFDDAKKQNVFDGKWVANTVSDKEKQNTYKTLGLLHDDGSYPTLHRSAFNYLPGVITPQYPDGIGDILLGKKNAFILNDIHYGPTWDTFTDSSYLHLYFSKSPPKRPVQEFQMGTLGISPVLPNLNLEPNKITKVYSQFIVPESISIINVNPHMHLLGKSFWGFATKPNGDTIPLVKIPAWDFNWQNFYTPINPIILPTGSTIFAVGEYDNTSKNPFNPNKPPKLVSDKNGSMRTTDEMFQFIISYMTYEAGDEKIDLRKKK